MKKIFEKENICLGIFTSIAAIFGILSIAFTSLPAYFEEGRADMSIIKMMIGDGRTAFSPLIMTGFILLIIGVYSAIILAVLHFLNKSDSLVTTILGISSIVEILIGAVILTSSMFILGLDKLNSELGFTQGIWGIKVGMILVPVMSLIAIGFIYPSALIILHHKDLADKANN